MTERARASGPERLARLETTMDEVVVPALHELRDNTEGLKGRLDQLSLNGHGGDLRQFVVHDMPVIRELVPYAKALVEDAQKQERRDEALAWFKSWPFWPHVGKIVWVLVGAVLSALAFWAIAGQAPPHFP